MDLTNMQFFYCNDEVGVEPVKKNKFQMLYITIIWRVKMIKPYREEPVLDL